MTATGPPLACRPRGVRPTGLFPALGGFVVRRAGLDPGCAAGALLLLPEGRAGLEVVHDELAGGEGVAAVRARHGHHDNLLVRLERPMAMDHRAVHYLPAPARLLDDLGNRALGHARVML